MIGKSSFRAVSFVVVLSSPLGAEASATYGLFLETNDDRPSGSEVYNATYDSHADLLVGDGFASSAGYTGLGIPPTFHVGGIAYDGQYRLLIESDDDRAAGAEIYSATFDSYADLLAGDGFASEAGFTGLGMPAAFDLVGFAFDGQYRLLLESNDDRAAGAEVFAVTYDSYADLIAGNGFASGSGFTGLGIPAAFDVVGFAFDGRYRLLLESNDDRVAGDEVFSVTFDSFADLLLGDGFASDSGFTGLGIPGGFGIAGLTAQISATGRGSVPLPSTLLLLGVGAALLRKRRRGGRVQ